MAKKIENETFEQQLAQLEALVQKMEQGGLSLDEMLTTYEDGVKLQKKLQEVLEKTKGRLTMIQNQEEVDIPLEELK